MELFSSDKLLLLRHGRHFIGPAPADHHYEDYNIIIINNSCIDNNHDHNNNHPTNIAIADDKRKQDVELVNCVITNHR